MAVEAHHLNPLFSSNREMMYPAEGNDTVPAKNTTFSPTVGCQTSLFNPFYNIAPVDCLVHQSPDSSLTFNRENKVNNFDFNRPVTSSSLGKRYREESIVVNPPTYTQRQKISTDPLMFLGQDLSFNDQFDIDRLVSNHMERMRIEIEEKRRTQRRVIMEAIEQRLMKKLKAKDEEINHIVKLNLFLEEKVKSLSLENQFWRNMAQSKEDTINTLRSNLQQVISTVEQNQWKENTVTEDVQSCCGSNDEFDSNEDRRRLVGEAQDNRMICRACEREEASVLLLPCRHMCLCTVCGSLLNTCPICKSPKNATLHVNLT